ncbi:hypothetical protein MPUL_27070 [Mycolicibacterium pulveris]|uniref:Uncharacterized protein n=1 Tax=Mycolicibacterium pulveris TaxID=36813 RepID=A0A7I7ULJ8_MYCPV|nr:hypothetical protein MPUL_27070 [Mycolicibacterium pulveris]
MHRPLDKQLEDGGADVAAATTAPSSAATATRARTEAEPERRAAPPRSEAGRTLEAGGVVLADMLSQMLAEIAAGLTAQLVKASPVAGAESEAPGRGGKWNGHGHSLDLWSGHTEVLSIR